MNPKNTAAAIILQFDTLTTCEPVTVTNTWTNALGLGSHHSYPGALRYSSAAAWTSANANFLKAPWRFSLSPEKGMHAYVGGFDGERLREMKIASASNMIRGMISHQANGEDAQAQG